MLRTLKGFSFERKDVSFCVNTIILPIVALLTRVANAVVCRLPNPPSSCWSAINVASGFLSSGLTLRFRWSCSTHCRANIATLSESINAKNTYNREYISVLDFAPVILTYCVLSVSYLH